MKNSKRKKQIDQKSKAKENRMKKPGAKSNYAKKKTYLHSYGGFGFDYDEKPWK